MANGYQIKEYTFSFKLIPNLLILDNALQRYEFFKLNNTYLAGQKIVTSFSHFGNYTTLLKDAFYFC